MLCKLRTMQRSNKSRRTDNETKGSNNIQKTKHACIVTRKRLESTLPKDHEDHNAERGFNSLSHCNLVHKFVPMPQATNIPDIHARRINAKGVLTPQGGEELKFLTAGGTTKLSGRDHEYREPTPSREQLVGSEDLSGELQGEPEGFQPREKKMTLKPVPTFGRFKVTSFIVIALNLEYNSVCRKKKHSVFH